MRRGLLTLCVCACFAYGEHWAYVAPRSQQPPASTSAWVRNPVDRFILNRLEREGLRPSPEANRATLLRRLTLDLTGLPPSQAELAAFLADKAPNAYDKTVERLLASPHFGERMAIDWLDLARYADTHGYQLDAHREMWPWRDWVISAFNRNLPFDQFTIEQLAGDLLPGATVAQKIATGFNRNHMINSEGGSLPEEFQVEYVVDRVETVSTVWLGTTLGCARCHDHKYDPFTRRDFYRFFAFFNSVPENGVDGAYGNAAPFLSVASPAQQSELDRLNSGMAGREKLLAPDTIGPLLEQWENANAEALPATPRRGLTAEYGMNGSLERAVVLTGELLYGPGPVDQAAILNGVTRVQTDARLSPAFSIALWQLGDGRREMTVLQTTADARQRRGFELLVDEPRPMPGRNRGSHLMFRLVNRWPNDAMELRSRERITQNNWHHIAVTYDGARRASGVRVYVDGKAIDCDVVRDSLTAAPASARAIEIGNGELGTPFQGQLDDLRVFDRPLTSGEVDVLAGHEPARAALAKPAVKRTQEEKDRLRRYFLTHAAPASLRTAFRELNELEARRNALAQTIPTVMTMEELAQPRETSMLARGDYRYRGEKVTPATPAKLTPVPPAAPANRLGLARWIVDPGNPLTARVAVNRYWQMYFGVGLVSTPENFGTQGEAPSHPELLDWLAGEFMRTGWDVKAMQRLLVTSATYRQSSRLTPVLLERDPANRLLARGPRVRLPAEAIRDSALFAAGLLDGRIGGRSVFPYQPEGVWEELTVGDVNSAQVYAQDHGPDLYRRGLYTFWKRTAPPPSLTAFDAPDREKCVALRQITNTPMQALALMNDPTYVEAARVLATSALRQPDPAAYLFRTVLAREPSSLEKRAVANLAAANVAAFRQRSGAAEKLLRVGESSAGRSAELAGWTTAASVVLSMDEAITRQ